MKAFEKLGIQVKEEAGFIHCKAEEIVGNDIQLDFPSVGATENVMLASVFAKGTTRIINAAMEPEIIDLQNALNKMGAKISGAGTNNITIRNDSKKYKDNTIKHNIIQNRMINIPNNIFQIFINKFMKIFITKYSKTYNYKPKRQCNWTC